MLYAAGDAAFSTASRLHARSEMHGRRMSRARERPSRQEPQLPLAVGIERVRAHKELAAGFALLPASRLRRACRWMRCSTQQCARSRMPALQTVSASSRAGKVRRREQAAARAGRPARRASRAPSGAVCRRRSSRISAAASPTIISTSSAYSMASENRAACWTAARRSRCPVRGHSLQRAGLIRREVEQAPQEKRVERVVQANEREKTSTATRI